MSSVALAALLGLLADDERLLETERIVRRLMPDVPEIDDDTRQQAELVCAAGAEHGLVLARAWFAGLIMGGLDRDAPTVALGIRPFAAYVVAALAARTRRLPEATRWLRVGHVEAEADALGAEEVVLFIAAVRLARQ